MTDQVEQGASAAQRGGITLREAGQSVQPSAGDLKALRWFNDLVDGIVDTRRDAPQLAHKEAEILSWAVKAHYLADQPAVAVALGDIFKKAHGAYWPTSIDTANARDLTGEDVEACIAEHRALIADIRAHEPMESEVANKDEGGYWISDRHAELVRPYTRRQWGRYLSMAHVNLGSILVRIGRDKESVAETLLSMECTSDPDQLVDRNLRLARLMVRTGDMDAARSRLTEARSIDDAGAQRWLAEIGPMYEEFTKLPLHLRHQTEREP